MRKKNLHGEATSIYVAIDEYDKSIAAKGKTKWSLQIYSKKTTKGMSSHLQLPKKLPVKKDCVI